MPASFAMNAAFRQNVLRILGEKSLRRVDLAQRLGVGQGYVTKLLSEGYNPSLETLEKVATALEVDPSKLLEASAA